MEICRQRGTRKALVNTGGWKRFIISEKSNSQLREYNKRSTDQQVSGSTPDGCTTSQVVVNQVLPSCAENIKTPESRLFFGQTSDKPTGLIDFQTEFPSKTTLRDRFCCCPSSYTGINAIRYASVLT